MANSKNTKQAKRYEEGFLPWLAEFFQNNQSSAEEQALAKVYGKHNLVYDDNGNFLNKVNIPDELSAEDLTKLTAKHNTILPKQQAMHDLSKGVTLGQTAKLGLNAAAEHPFYTAGLVGAGVGNIAGLTDNDKYGGQIGGLGLGGLGAYLLSRAGVGVNPYVGTMMTLGGGALGSLFDKLRARKEQEQEQLQQYQQGYTR